MSEIKYFNRNMKHLKFYKDESTIHQPWDTANATHQASIIYENQCKHLKFLENLIH